MAKAFTFIFLSFALLSCFTPKSITNKGEQITLTTLQSMKSGKVYDFKIKDGTKQKIIVEKVQDSVVYGKIKRMYAASGMRIDNYTKNNLPAFNSDLLWITENVKEIRTKEFNPYLTFGIPVLILGVGVYIEDNINIDPY